ncbi:MAG: hypothetical protein HY908_21610 [Myxococcales bacterium]|nr:hypothetical protein [Myxococcales bacterium]
MRRTALFMTTLAVLLASLAAACGDDLPSDGSGGGAGTTTTTTTTTTTGTGPCVLDGAELDNCTLE